MPIFPAATSWRAGKGTLANGNDIQVQTYYDRTNRYEPNFGEIRNTFDIDFLQHLPCGERQQITWGLGARFSHADDPAVVSGLTVSARQANRLALDRVSPG